MERKCIYCGATEDLSESDIIPDALTNARIFNKNVCRIAHNNRFSDLFESKVISDLAFITNELDIKSSKGKRYAAYDAIVTIEGESYDVSLHSDRAILDGHVLKSTDQTHMLGSYETMVKIAKDESLVEKIDINQIEIEKTVRINTEIFFDPAMFRMVAKIAYEWYCARNHVADFHPEFSSIVSYITEGSGTCPVSVIQTKEIYDFLSTELSLGSHTLFGFEATDGKINVIVSLFGVLIYRVIIADTRPAFCLNNFLFTELRTDSLHKKLEHRSLAEATASFFKALDSKNFTTEAVFEGISVLIPHSFEQAKDIPLYPFVFDSIKCFDEVHDDVVVPNALVMEILTNQIQKITQESLLHKRTIRRFVSEYFKEGHEPICLNPNTSNKKATILFYAVFIVGKSGIEQLNDVIFQQVLKDSFKLAAGDAIVVTDELEVQLKTEMLGTDNYSEILEKGAEVINKWIN